MKYFSQVVQLQKKFKNLCFNNFYLKKQQKHLLNNWIHCQADKDEEMGKY